MEIKEGTIADLPIITPQMKVFNDLAKDAYGEFQSFDAIGIQDSMLDLLSFGGKFWILWDENKFAGIIAGAILPNFYNPIEKIGSCLFVGILPEYQKNRQGKKLRKVFEDWTIENGVGVIAYYGYDPNFIRSMKRSGFKQVEVALMKRV